MSKSDRELFLQALGEVRILRHDRIEDRALPPPPTPRQTRQDEARVLGELLLHDAESLDVQTGEELSWLRAGLPQKILRQLRRGRFAVADELDLHHLRESTARQCVLDFIAACVSDQQRCVRIIHGKGQRSRHGPVLKNMTAHLLPRIPAVQAFCSARQVDGGTGAVYVLLHQR